MYLEVVEYTYEILEPGPLRITQSNDQVRVRGDEVAYLFRQKQVVRSEWLAVMEMAGHRIAMLSMTIYRWTILATDICWRQSSASERWSCTQDTDAVTAGHAISKLLRVPLSASSVLTSPRTLRAGTALSGPARYVLRWLLA